MRANYIRSGRLVRIIRGPRQDRIGVIIDIVDANRVLVENPSDGKMWRHVQSIKNVEPLRLCVPISRNCSSKVLKEAMTSAKTLEKYATTKSAVRIAAKKALAESTDFERYQLRVAKRTRAYWSRRIFDENDKESPVSWHMIALKKLQKNAKKVDSTPAAKKRIEKARAARKAKPAGAKRKNKK
uniref:Uncharacterized protein TCIL3000_6_270 n=1 Tax=Trypanosoma congolense (strain IL3000) TaxID=1068625 RepID=G0UN41_TRYCI|nr:unnamed protein product [Trypanosoma congolense IL3000]